MRSCSSCRSFVRRWAEKRKEQILMREEERRMEKEESRRELERKKEVVEDEIAKEKKLQRVKTAKMSSQCLCLLPGGGVGERDHEKVEAVGPR